MEPILSHGNKIAISLAGIILISLCTAFYSYRLKKTSQIKLWEKELKKYSLELEEENQIAKGNSLSEEK